MISSSQGSGSAVFERMDEYKAVLDNLVQLSARRQNTNNVFVGLNTVFLTGLGVLLFSTRLASWWVVGGAGAISLAILPLNLSWRTSIKRYKHGINVRKEYLQEIERALRARHVSVPGEAPLGLFLKIKEETPLHQHGNTELELRLVAYFICLYPLITLLVAVLTLLVINRTIPPLAP